MRKRFSISSKLLLIIMAAMLLSHVIFFIYYTQENKRAEANVNRDIIVQQVMNLIERINYTAADQREDVVDAVDIPNINISLDDSPQWKQRFNNKTSLWQISEALRNQHNQLKLSLEYDSDTWLNIAATFVRTPLLPQILLLTLELIIVAAILFTIWTINRFAIPFENFKKAAEQLGVDLDSPPLPEAGPTIVRETASAMNKMQERIRELIKERTHMLAALSHDLRTPITRIKLRSQFVNDSEIFQKNIADLDQMEIMIAETIAFAKNNSRSEKKVKLDLNSLLQSICDDFKDMGSDVQYFSNEQLVAIQGHSIALKRAFNNLIENALKYGKKAEINLQVKEEQVLITIDDDGPGVSEDQLEKVFEPFYRGDNSRSRETGGTGLGLSVARDIIQDHEGDITLSNLNEGLRVTILLSIA